jgi:hypothetical protein
MAHLDGKALREIVPAASSMPPDGVHRAWVFLF